MKQVLLITYQLASPQENQEMLLRSLGSQYPDHVRLSNSTFLISTEESPVDVRNYLAKHLTQNDQLFVSLAIAPSAWVHTEQVATWIRAHQTAGGPVPV